MEEKNLHDGHRKRLREKFKNYESALTDHEVLELLLGYSIPRKDTNALAHKLINKFGSLHGVLTASRIELAGVDGIGENTALFLSVINGVNKRVATTSQAENNRILTIDEAKNRLVKLFEGATTEIFYALYLNKQDKVINMVKVESQSASSVTIDATEFTRGILANKPTSVIIAHNHFAKYPYPSNEDDETTAKLYALLHLYGVNFYDHIIVSGSEIYSYFYDNRLQNIKNKINNQLF